MISKSELIALLNDMESSRIERTESISDTDKFSKAVCAFSNDLPNTRKPGYLVIGADDKSGKPSGLRVTDELLRNLGGLRSDGNILPLPAISIEKLSFDDGDVAVVEVQPCDMPPVRYKGQVWVRIGPRRAVANEHEERILAERRTSQAKNFDIWPVKEAKISDLSQRLFSDYRNSIVDSDIIAENHRSIEEQLASLRFFDLLNNCPTIGGILLFGSNPRYYLPGSYIQFLKFPGNAMTETPIDQLEISGTVPNMADIAKEKVIGYNQTRMKRGDDLRDIISSDYPEWAFREFLHNALIHRDYQSNAPVRFYWFEDRVEIQSPGGLYGRVTVDTITRVNDYRNPVIAEAMKALGYVNRFGYGIQNAQKLLEKNGNPPAEITADQHTVLVIIRKGRA
jgi:ATP-dependent DNA helicase RecG